ncbi:hypothetical protein WISP_38203 [Willisornis vidua]|uniref:Uncharacterized protein n=1 Tax=Willisornis vidua TaxID=1566151 RepID=A0ABQ9DMC2_9PASS|nr:hypothetical protein WISP_38203 [Willisornis vidua]
MEQGQYTSKPDVSLSSTSKVPSQCICSLVSIHLNKLPPWLLLVLSHICPVTSLHDVPLDLYASMQLPGVEIQTQAVDLEVAISIKPAKNTVEAQTQADANTAPVLSVETQTQTVDLEAAISTKPTKATVEAQTQADVDTVPIRSVRTQTQVTNRRITIAPIKKKTARMKETTKPIKPPPQLEREE